MKLFEIIYAFVTGELFNVAEVIGLTQADLDLIHLVALIVTITIVIGTLVLAFKFVKWAFYKIANGGQ